MTVKYPTLFSVLDAVSHDLKSPVASILSVLSLIKLKKNRISAAELQTGLDEYLDRAEEKALFLNENIDALFAAGAILENSFEVQKKTLDLQTVVETFQFALKKFEWPEFKEEVKVVGDAEWLPKAFTAIFQHVDRLREENSMVQVSLQKNRTNALLKITYSGKAVENESFELAAFLPKINKVVRLSLWVAVQVIEKLGGKVECQQTEDTQNIFSITMPLVE
jgi:K+-sensing histidine kinase KdpD